MTIKKKFQTITKWRVESEISFRVDKLYFYPQHHYCVRPCPQFLSINCNNVKYSFIPLHIQIQASNLAAVLHTIENIPCMKPEWCLPRLPRPQWDMTWDIVSHSGFCTQLNKNLSSAEVSHVPGVGETAELHCHRRYYIIWSTNFLHHPFQLMIFFIRIINPLIVSF